MHFRKNYFLLSVLLLLFNFLMAQNYQAINGSPYAGSLAPGSNPAFIVNVPYTWDITLFAVQAKQTTNAFIIKNYSFLSSPNNAEIFAQNGVKKRFAFANQDIRLLNARINLNTKSAIAFGANIRNYVYSTTSENNWEDTTKSLTGFMKINLNHVPLSGEARGTSWAEFYGTYAHTIIDDGTRILTAGLTLKVNRALAGGYAIASDLGYTPEPGNEGGYLLTTGALQYGYSSNFDTIDSNSTSSTNRKNFLQHTMAGISADAGLEYILLDNNGDEGGSDLAYRTKIGISLMDIGRNKFRYSTRSSAATAGKPGVTDSVLMSKFSNVGSIDDFNDSLASIANTFNQITGAFNVYQPARIVINVDQHIVNDFFVNAELTLPLLSLIPKKLIYIKDMNLLAVTPRWEIKSFGAYMPVLVNNKGQAWIGAAFKAGPILIGTHNLGTLFSKDKSQTGGFYIALTIRPGKNSEGQGGGQKEKLSAKERRSLDCPKL
jgi:hypothetical protein